MQVSPTISKKLKLYLADSKAIILQLSFLLFLLSIPLLPVNSFVLRMLIMVGLYSLLALSLNLITGYAGQLSLGHAAFYAIGAYTSALLSLRLGYGFVITAFFAASAAALTGFILGIPVLKLQGAYLAIVTLGFNEIVRIVALNWMSLTRGPMGLPGIPSPTIFGYHVTTTRQYYYLMLVLVMLTALILYRIIHSRIGRAFIAIREDELAARSMGVNPHRYKILAFVISAFFAGLAGSFYAHFMTYIDPQSFTFEESIQILSMIVLGGMGSMPGAVIGAFILVVSPELLRSLQDYRMVMYGAVLVIMMLLRPQGILGGARFRRKKEESQADVSSTRRKHHNPFWGFKSR